MDSAMLTVIILLSSLFQGCLARCYYYSYSYYCYSSYYLTGGSVAGVVIGCIIGVGIVIALIVACCVKGCCSTQSPGVVFTQQPQGMTVSHVSASHMNQGYVHGYGQGPPPYSTASAYPGTYPAAGQKVMYQPPYTANPPPMQQHPQNAPMHSPVSQAPQIASDMSYLAPVGSSVPSTPNVEIGDDDRTYERLQVQK